MGGHTSPEKRSSSNTSRSGRRSSHDDDDAPLSMETPNRATSSRVRTPGSASASAQPTRSLFGLVDDEPTRARGDAKTEPLLSDVQPV